MTNYPTATQYNDALQNPNRCFNDADLKSSMVATSSIGLPQVWSGGFAYTYRLTARNKKVWAVRCFNKAVLDRQLRYKAISNYLQSYTMPFLRTIEYLEDELLVGGKRYPITKMPWVDGTTLGAYIEQNYQNPATLAELAGNFRNIIDALSQLQIAHGDLSHDNILVQPGSQLILVDYDGMWVPELSQIKKSSENGHKNFQHYKRTEDDFGPNLDRFSSITIYLALYALLQLPNLWQRYKPESQEASKVEGLLFQQKDFLDPQRSPLLGELRNIPALRGAVVAFEKICQGPLSKVPSLNDFIANAPSLAKLTIEVNTQSSSSPQVAPSVRVYSGTPSTASKNKLTPQSSTYIPRSTSSHQNTPANGGYRIGLGIVAIMGVIVLFFGWMLTNFQIDQKTLFSGESTQIARPTLVEIGSITTPNLEPTAFVLSPAYTPELAQATPTSPVDNIAAVTPMHTEIVVAPSATQIPTSQPTDTPLPTVTHTPTLRPTDTPLPTDTPTPPPTNTPTIGELQAMVKRRINSSSVSNPYSQQTALFVDAITTHLGEFQLPSLGITEQSVRQALYRADVGDRVNGLVKEVWGEWTGLTSDVWKADPQNFNLSPFRQLVIRLIQGRQTHLVDSQQHALHSFFSRKENRETWHNGVDGVIAAINRDSFQWSR